MARYWLAVACTGFFLYTLPSADALGAQKRALLIGVNDYLANDSGAERAEGSWVPEDLQGAVNDISLMQQVLVSRFGFEPQNIQRLEDAAATRSRLLQTLEQFVADTAADDIVYIHFSGHGSQVEDQDGDEPDGLDETILPYDARTDGVADITDDELQRIFARLPAGNSLIVLDSCHSGTATRGSSALRARSVPLDARGELYAGLPPASRPASQPAYVLMTGAADYQSALDGPLDEGRHYGLFTLSLGRSLSRVPQGASAADLHAEARREMERIGAEFGLFAVPEAQLEGDPGRVGQGILGETRALASRSTARLAWLSVTPDSATRVRLVGARTLAARAGSVWALYPPGETRFVPGAAFSTVVISHIEGEDALAELDARIDIAPGSRAIPVLEAPARETVPVRLERMPDADRAALTKAVGERAGGELITWAGPGSFARFIVDRETTAFSVHGAGGLQRVASLPAEHISQAAEQLIGLARRSHIVNELLALENAGSGIRVTAAVNPVDAAGGVRGVAVVGAADAPAFRVRRPGMARDRSNSLVLEIATSEDAYLTIVDIDPAGAVATLFPNPISQQNGFYPDGRVPGGRAVRIPDSLGNNRAGFNWDYVPPAGVDTIRIFAASDLTTARKIRAYVAQVGSAMQQRGSGRLSRRDLVSGKSGLQTRGIQTTPTTSVATGDWAATTVTVVIEE
jgi:hypothetical protein